MASEQKTVAPVVAPASDAEAAKALQEIDLEHYRTHELVDNISELISIPAFVVRVFKCMFCVVVASWILIPLVFGKAGIGWLVPLVLYATAGALIVGTAVGITYSLGRALGNMVQIADLTFHVTDQVVHDFSSLAGGKKSWPSPRQFVLYVYDFVIIPCIEKAFERVFWFFGTLVVWVYKITLGRILRFMLKFTPAGKIVEQPQDESLSESKLNDERESFRHTWINTTRQWIQSLGIRLTWAMLFPLVLVCTGITGFILAPLVVAWRYLLF
jgi:hypothetical protein